MDDTHRELARTIEDRLASHTIRQFLDFHIADLSAGYCVLSIDFKGKFDNTTGAIHGGILAMLADSAVACALASQFGGEMNFATSSLDIHFLRRASTAVTAAATIIKTGSRVCVGTVDLHDADGRQVATAICDFVLLERRER